MDSVKQIWAQASDQFPILLNFGLTLASALTFLIIGWILARWIRNRIRQIKIGNHEIDPTLRPVFASAIFYVIMAMTVYAVLIKLGVPPASLLAVFGAAGLAIGLALKDTLSNIAAGVMMLILRPLAVGDFVDTGSASGTVIEIGLFATTLQNPDGLYIYIPNSQVWTDRIQNFGRHNRRKAVIDIGVGYDTDLKVCTAVLMETLKSADNLIDEPNPPEVYVMGFGDSAINMSCRCWLPGDNWFQRTSDLRVKLKSALDAANIDIPFPQRVVTLREKI